jgi:hypothetical protein
MNQEQILTVLQKLSSAIADGGMTKTIEHKTIERVIGTQDQVVESEEEDIDPAIAEIIHAKAVDKMVKNTKSQVVHIGKKIKDDSMDAKISELEDLLGDK